MNRSLLLLSLFFVSCGGEGRPDAPVAVASAAVSSPDVERVDPCALLTGSEVETLFGPLKEGPVSKTGLRRERECHYTNEGGSWLTVSVYGGGDERWDWEKGITNANPQTPISGLGDVAFAARRGTDSLVYVRRGDSILQVSCSCGADGALAIARQAATRF